MSSNVALNLWMKNKAYLMENVRCDIIRLRHGTKYKDVCDFLNELQRTKSHTNYMIYVDNDVENYEDIVSLLYEFDAREHEDVMDHKYMYLPGNW